MSKVISCGNFYCVSSPNQTIKTVTAAGSGVAPNMLRMLQGQRTLYCPRLTRQLMTYNIKALNSIQYTRMPCCWTFYRLRLGLWSNIRPATPKYGLEANLFALTGINHGLSRNLSSFQNHYNQKNKTTAIYIIALITVVLGGSYAAVPLYRIFCQASGLGGTVQQVDAGEKIKNMTAKKERLVTVRFNADKSATMQWSFKPQQPEVKVYPGETALAFYTAKNPTDVPITGISTYNVIPFEAGQYFNKIQCFCFEEQRLNPHEKVDMPVFFYIDPEFLEDPALYKVDTIILSYTFFQAKEAHDLGI